MEGVEQDDLWGSTQPKLFWIKKFLLEGVKLTKACTTMQNLLPYLVRDLPMCELNLITQHGMTSGASISTNTKSHFFPPTISFTQLQPLPAQVQQLEPTTRNVILHCREALGSRWATSCLPWPLLNREEAQRCWSLFVISQLWFWANKV